MDNSTNNTQQNTQDQPVTQPVKSVTVQSDIQPEPVTAPIQNTARLNSVKTSAPAGKQMQQPSAVINRGGIIVNPTPPQPVSAPSSKEQEPARSMPDVVKMTEAEIVHEEEMMSNEIKEIVSESPDVDKPAIPQEVKEVGVEPAKTDSPMPTSPSGKVVLPMTYTEAELTRKKYRWKDSIAWFATLLVYHWKRINLKSQKKEE